MDYILWMWVEEAKLWSGSCFVIQAISGKAWCRLGSLRTILFPPEAELKVTLSEEKGGNPHILSPLTPTRNGLMISGSNNDTDKLEVSLSKEKVATCTHEPQIRATFSLFASWLWTTNYKTCWNCLVLVSPNTSEEGLKGYETIPTQWQTAIVHSLLKMLSPIQDLQDSGPCWKWRWWNPLPVNLIGIMESCSLKNWRKNSIIH